MRVGLVLNDGLVLAVPVCQYITTYLPTHMNGRGEQGPQHSLLGVLPPGAPLRRGGVYLTKFSFVFSRL